MQVPLPPTRTVNRSSSNSSIKDVLAFAAFSFSFLVFLFSSVVGGRSDETTLVFSTGDFLSFYIPFRYGTRKPSCTLLWSAVLKEECSEAMTSLALLLGRSRGVCHVLLASGKLLAVFVTD